MADKIIAVVGATGAQGGGLVRAILNDPNGGFKVRAIIRDVNSDKAKALTEMGADVSHFYGHQGSFIPDIERPNALTGYTAERGSDYFTCKVVINEISE